MPHPDPAICRTCGKPLGERDLLCPECQQFTPRSKTVLTRWGIAFAVVFLPIFLFLVILTLRTQ